MDPCAQLHIDRHVKYVGRWPIMELLVTSAPVRMLQYLFWPQKWIPRAKLPVNRHTTCKKCTKMTNNLMVGY